MDVKSTDPPVQKERLVEFEITGVGGLLNWLMKMVSGNSMEQPKLKSVASTV